MDIKKVLSSAISQDLVQLKGWVRSKRGSKNVCFIALNDGSTLHNIQIVVEGVHFDDTLKVINTGASILVEGKLVVSKGSGQAVELLAHKLEIIGKANPEEYPLQPKKTFSRIS
jgi:asparaginyl-tRNA synthetase